MVKKSITLLGMKTLRNPGKVDLLLNLFDGVGSTYSVKEVCEMTGIKNYNSLKALASYIRKAKHIPDENRIDIRIRDERCVRVN
jgi:hypothetical protein